MKQFSKMSNVGCAKYLVSFHDGTKKNLDGSNFFDMRIFKNKKKMESFVKELSLSGYTERI